MIGIEGIEGKKYAVFGLARTGVAAVRALQAAGADVIAGDDDAARLEVVGDAATDLASAEFSNLSGLIMSPGVPLTHPLAEKARDANVPLIGDMELFAMARHSLPQHKLVGITGTNGKSTTAALLHHLLSTVGIETALAGNIGNSVLELDPVADGGTYVFEMSSFQIDLTRTLDVDVAVLLNLAPDHLDRHGDMAGYVAAKERLFSMQKAGQVAVIGIDSDESRRIAASLPQRVVPISAQTAAPGGVYVLDGVLYDGLEDSSDAIAVGSLAEVETLRGRHNWQNAAAAYAAARLLGASSAALFAAMASFPGLPHRLEVVAHGNSVAFVNDSKATNTASAREAISAIDGDIYWIAGGLLKEANLDALAPVLGRVTKAFLIGEAADVIAGLLNSDVDCEIAGTLELATNAAAKAAFDSGKRSTVLLSPACASYDQFGSFEERGDKFRALAADLASGASGGNAP